MQSERWKYSARYQSSNPARPLAWRWELACLLIQQQRRISTRNDDAWVQAAVRFKRRLERSNGAAALGRLKSSEPGLFAAYELFDSGGFPRWRVEAWLLTGLSMLELANRSGLPVAAVEAFEALFFNVSDRLDAAGYITTIAIGGLAAGEQPSKESVVKAFAYYSGPLILEVLLRDAIDAQGNLRPLDDLDLSTADSRTAGRARLALMVEMLPFSPGLISETVRIRELMASFELQKTPRADVNPDYDVLQEAFDVANRDDRQRDVGHDDDLLHRLRANSGGAREHRQAGPDREAA